MPPKSKRRKRASEILMKARDEKTKRYNEEFGSNSDEDVEEDVNDLSGLL